MASTKLVALFFFAFAVAAAILPQPTDARPQLLKPDYSDQAGRTQHPALKVAAPVTTTTPSSPPQPMECLTPLTGMLPCMGYLTNLTVLTPPTTCCDGLKSIVKDAPICLCHSMNGDLNSFMPQHIDQGRMMMLPLVCGAIPPLQIILSCNTLTVPPIFPPVAPVPPTMSP